MSKPELAMFAKEGTGRAYKHPFRLDGDGKPIQAPSITTVLKMVNKGEGIAQWAADQTLQWAVDNVSLLFTKDHESSKKWGRWRWKDARDERAEVGTGIHETIEAEHTNSWEYPELDEEQEEIMEQWRLFNERYEVTPHRSEFTVWDTDFDYAGTADGLWDVTDRETGESWTNLVIDLKTSKSTWPEHWMQLSALARARYLMVKEEDGTWKELQREPSDGIAIVHLRRDYFEFLPETDTTIIDAYFDEFCIYREAWGAEKRRESLLKKREVAQVAGF